MTTLHDTICYDSLSVMNDPTPLCVDLDGTLVTTDTLYESFLQYLKKHPLAALLALQYLRSGRASFKHHISGVIQLDPALLPYNQPFLNWLKAQKAGGRPLHLVTAAHQSIAQSVANHTQLFTSVIASDNIHNRKGQHKAQDLLRTFGDKQFDYAGNDYHDLAIWPHARHAIVVNANARTTQAAERLKTPVIKQFTRQRPAINSWLLQLRTYQWVKNLLLFVPILTAHQLTNLPLLSATILAFISFSFMASAIYILNDLLDLSVDRLHPHKKNRPLAAGIISIQQGVLAGLLAAAFSLFLSFFLPLTFTTLLVIYALFNILYSFRLKKVPFIDVFALATMYVLRILAGAAATAIPVSAWLFLFAGLIFISFGLIKRVNELAQNGSPNTKLAGRGYSRRHQRPLTIFGVATGLTGLAVFSLYLQSPATRVLYRQPHLLWVLIPFFLFWLLRMWKQAAAGRIHHDPIITATRDPISYLTALSTLVIIFLAS